MAKNTDWREDSEAFGIAVKLQERYPDLFGELDLGKVKFIRNLSGTYTKAGELKACTFPYDISSPYAYYLIIENSYWKELSEAQRNLAVMHLLYGIAPGGTDETSNNYAKCRRHDVKDFNVVLAAAGGRYDWQEVGKTGINDPLAEQPEIVTEA